MAMVKHKEQTMIETQLACVSVAGGWTTAIINSRTAKTIEKLGPAFHNIVDLWNWQRDNPDKLQNWITNTHTVDLGIN
jgi:tetrahydromethanopterin S-methyltransferase subunit H